MEYALTPIRQARGGRDPRPAMREFLPREPPRQP